MADAVELVKRLKSDHMRLKVELARLVEEEEQADGQHDGSPIGKREEVIPETFELEKRIAIKNFIVNGLIEIETAMNKVESGTYGVCDICKNNIEPVRLEALPQATLCLKCKSSRMKNARSS